MRLLIIVLPILLALAAQAQNEVQLSVRNRTGVAQKGVPVRGGVPFNKGVLKECASAKLLDAGGKGLPCRVRPIARWYDGSVKWLYLDFMHDFSQSGQHRYTVAYGNQVRCTPSPATVRMRPTDGVARAEGER
jgi:hypothetical protein